MRVDRSLLSATSLARLEALHNPAMMEVVEGYLELLKPARVTVVTDDPAEIARLRELALNNREEHALAMEGHTVHFDGYRDQGRDRGNTRVLLTPGVKISKVIRTVDRAQGLADITSVMDGIMEGKEALICFFTLGPLGSRFAISALQITDSAYVAHSEAILYRPGYEQFKKVRGGDFFTFIHAAGRLDERGNSREVDRRRIYIDLRGSQVLTVNNQYAGNSVGLKKLALRLAIHRANHQDWLAEHMFLMGVRPQGKDRVTYFAGAFPSACGKTSTAMVPGQMILGDDIAYLREGTDGRPWAVNIEQGIFGIIMDVNPADDPLIYKALTTPRELIFSNVLVNGGKPYWLGMGGELPQEGRNHYSDRWKKGDTDAEGMEVALCHRNARYTIPIADLDNADPRLHDPEGVPVEGIIYGGRDSDTSVPVYQSLDWVHGVAIGATLESESTFATIGASGQREFSPMANLDFLVVPLGRYIANHIAFGQRLDRAPLVFATNYFLKQEGRFLNQKVDKKVWLLWMEGRIHGEYEAVETPIGHIPRYEDLKALFAAIFSREYTRGEYDRQFTIRADRFLEKLSRMEAIYAAEEEVPAAFTGCLKMLRERLEQARAEHGTGEIPPERFGA